MRFGIIVGLGACLAACSPEAAPKPEADATANAAVAPAPPVAAPAVQAPAAVVAPLLNIRAEGVAFVDPTSGSSRGLDFGFDRAVVQQAVTTVLGAPKESGSNPECGAGPLDFARFPGGLTLWFQEGKFVGWALGGDADPSLQTAAGLGLGAARSKLDEAYAAKVSETTLGQEFEAGGMSGILSSPGPDGRVTALWSGVSCVFR